MAGRRGAGMTKQVVCINWGDKYGPRYINRLYAMTARNLTPPFSVTCFTDSAEGVRPEVRCLPLPELGFEIPPTRRGVWLKSRLWGARLGDLEGPVLFMDLDLVIVGSLDPFFDYGEPEEVILARNPNVPLERLGQTSVFRFPVGKLKPLQDMLAADPVGIPRRYRFEQRFVTREAPGGVRFWPRRWVRHFRQDCHRTPPLNYVLEPRLPRDARIVIFPGRLSPEDAIAGSWGRGYKPRSPVAHVRAAFSREFKHGPIRYLRHYIKPARWVREAWRED